MALTHAQKTGLEAAILAYLTAEGGRFARTVAAFKEEAQGPGAGGNDEGNNLIVNGAVLEKAWTHLHHTLKSKGNANQKAFFAAIESGDVAEVQLYGCVGIDVKAFRYTCEYFNDDDDEEEEEAEGVDVSPLYWAAQHDQLAIVKYFVESGHDKDFGDDDDISTPLSIAAQNDHIAVVQYLVEQGADKDKADNEGTTPLYITAHQGHLAVVRYLVEHGADIDKATSTGHTPLMIAETMGHAEMAAYLRAAGAGEAAAAGGAR